MALYGQSVDVSLVDAPVLNDLVAMHALRPFTQREIDWILDLKTPGR